MLTTKLFSTFQINPLDYETELEKQTRELRDFAFRQTDQAIRETRKATKGKERPQADLFIHVKPR